MYSNNNGTQSEELGIQDYISLVFRRKNIILSVFVIVFGVVALYTFLKPPIFKSSATFIVESQDVGFGPAKEMTIVKNARPLGFYEALLHSQIFINKVMEDAHRDSLLRQRARIDDENLLRTLRKDLTLKQSEYSELIEMSVKASDPTLAYRLALISSNALKLRCQEIEQEEAHNVVAFVQTQIDLARGNLEQAERDLHEFKEKTQITFSQEDGGIVKRLMEFENQLAEIETQRQLAQANFDSYRQRLQQLKPSQSASLLENDTPEVALIRKNIESLEEEKNRIATVSGLNSPQIRAIDKQLENKKDELRQVILSANQVSNAAPQEDQSLRSIYLERGINEELNLYMLRNRENFYRRLIENYRRQHPNMLEHTIELARLQRSKTVNENLYKFLVEKAEEAKINAATGTGGIRTVDLPTIPQRPIPQQTTRNLILGFILGLGLGFGIALLMDYLDNTIRSQEDLHRLLGLSTLGIVPLIRGKNSKKMPVFATLPLGSKPKSSEDKLLNYKDRLISSVRPKDPIVDAYRNVRTNLQFVNVDFPIRKIMVTSSIPGEGKTLTTSNLAISFSELGKRVVLVDCDLRKSMQHVIFHLDKSPGLTDYLAKELPPSKILYRTFVPNLYVIPAGTNPPNPAEMLASQKMSELIDKLETHFDIVIFDSAPILPVTDPILLAAKAQNILLVIRHNQTNWHYVADAVQRLGHVNVKIVGALLNGVNGTNGYGYYRYNYYYYQDYQTPSPRNGFGNGSRTPQGGARSSTVISDFRSLENAVN